MSDGSVVPLVIDANQLTGDSYEVTFDIVDDETVWNLTNTSTSTQILSNQTNQTGDDEYATVDGMLLKVVGPSPGVKDWDVPQEHADLPGEMLMVLNGKDLMEQSVTVVLLMYLEPDQSQ